MKVLLRNKTGLVVNGNFLKVAPRLKPASVDLIMADPPFNIDYGYDQYNDRVPASEYLQWTSHWIQECVRLLKPHGSMFVAIGDDYAAELRLILDGFGLHRRNWIIWHYTFGVYCKGKFGRDHTHLFYYTKDKKRFKFNQEAVLVPSARQLLYNDRRANKAGRVPGDVWQFSRVCGTFKERTKSHPCQMPESVLERVVKVASDPGDVVLDPFGGSGTTAAVAKRLGRRFVTTEVSSNYAKAIVSRLAKVK